MPKVVWKDVNWVVVKVGELVVLLVAYVKID